VSGVGATLSPAVRRFAAIGLLLVAVAAIAGWLVRPLFRWAQDSTERLADAQFELARARIAARANKSVSATQIEAIEREVNAWLVAGAGEADAAARFQSTIDAVLSGEGLIVESVRVAPTVSAGVIHHLAMDWRGTGSEQSVVRAIATLERARPLIRIEKMGLRALEHGDSSQRPTAGTRLSVDLRLVAFWAAPAAPTAPPPKGGR